MGFQKGQNMLKSTCFYYGVYQFLV